MCKLYDPPILLVSLQPNYLAIGGGVAACSTLLHHQHTKICCAVAGYKNYKEYLIHTSHSSLLPYASLQFPCLLWIHCHKSTIHSLPLYY
jgi:hypothetical protein